MAKKVAGLSLPTVTTGVQRGAALFAGFAKGAGVDFSLQSPIPVHRRGLIRSEDGKLSRTFDCEKHGTPQQARGAASIQKALSTLGKQMKMNQRMSALLRQADIPVPFVDDPALAGC